jgi:predicted transcriptional regulator YheO
VTETMKHKRGVISRVRLSQSDKALLHAYEPVVEGIAKAFGSNCETVLHSLEDPKHSCIKIENGYITGRKVGSPLTDLALEVLDKANSIKSDIVGSYYNKTDDGRPLKSATILIRNSAGKLIGFMCINIDLSVPLVDFMKGFLPGVHDFAEENVSEHFPGNVDDLVGKTIELIMTGINLKRQISSTEKNKLIVKELHARGLFNVRGIIDVVAKQMGTSRYTVYNYLREAKLEGT